MTGNRGNNLKPGEDEGGCRLEKMAALTWRLSSENLNFCAFVRFLSSAA